jgi:hypothetical protein
MIVSDLFQMLSYGELSNLAIGNEAIGAIAPAAQPRIVMYANEALLRLHSRFILKERDLLLQIFDYIVNYRLLPRFAVSYVPVGTADNEPLRYILDSVNHPFTSDIIKILEVYGTEGRKLPLNDDDLTYSLFTPQPNTLQVPHPNTEQALSVVYQASHPKLQGDLNQIIDIPDCLVEAFTAFIAYKVFSHMNTEDSSSKAQEHMAMYEAICSTALDQDLLNTSLSLTGNRLHQRGWA